MSLRLNNVQIDVPGDDYDRAVDFWASALGAEVRQAPGPYVHLVGVPGQVGVHLQRLQEGPGRIHLDLETDGDPEAEAARLVEIGATRQGLGEDGPVLTDPAGNYFCVCRPGPSETFREATGDDPRVQIVVIDAASHVATRTGEFWAAALGVPAEPLPAPFDAYIRLEGAPTPAGGIGILVQDIGADAAPRIHLDLHVADHGARDRGVERLVGLGATVVTRDFPWTVLADPVGTVFCLVPDRPDAS